MSVHLNKPPIDPLVEKRARHLRDSIYGPSTDENWQACRSAWCRPDSVRWLEEFQWPKSISEETKARLS